MSAARARCCCRSDEKGVLVPLRRAVAGRGLLPGARLSTSASSSVDRGRRRPHVFGPRDPTVEAYYGAFRSAGPPAAASVGTQMPVPFSRLTCPQRPLRGAKNSSEKRPVSLQDGGQRYQRSADCSRARGGDGGAGVAGGNCSGVLALGACARGLDGCVHGAAGAALHNPSPADSTRGAAGSGAASTPAFYSGRTHVAHGSKAEGADRGGDLRGEGAFAAASTRCSARPSPDLSQTWIIGWIFGTATGFKGAGYVLLWAAAC